MVPKGIHEPVRSSVLFGVDYGIGIRIFGVLNVLYGLAHPSLVIGVDY